MLTKEDLKQFEKENRKIDRLLLEEYEPNLHICLKCGQEYDSGCGGMYSRIVCYCGVCLIEAING